VRVRRDLENYLLNTGSRVARERVKVLGLRLEEIDVDRLEEIASRIQDCIQSLLEELIPVSKSYDADIIVSIENKGDHVEVYIDVGVIGRTGDIVDYDSIVQAVVREAGRFVEEELRRCFGRDYRGYTIK